jgi:23S rRNA (cytidine1920-2'-O)/16S rRNA (cytidine1409-2'-O)-methyltransferase
LLRGISRALNQMSLSLNVTKSIARCASQSKNETIHYLCEMQEERLDKLLIQRNLVSTRVRAEKIIRETGVKVNGKLVTKGGKRFPVDCTIELLEEEIPWVSRGALKLLEAVEKWQPRIENGVFLDIGASTGGFTEVLLKNGAQKVYCVDVGSKQLHERIAEDERTVNLEKTHVRELSSNLIPELTDGCVIDVSFISLEKIFPFIHSFIKENGVVIALVKPQFEVGKENIGKGGIVKDKKLYPSVIENIKSSAVENNLTFVDFTDSPILGGDGNKEFLIYFKKSTS